MGGVKRLLVAALLLLGMGASMMVVAACVQQPAPRAAR
jgi:hypothetical protein